MEQKFAPSLMGMDLLNVQQQIEQLNKYAYMYHIDLIDWHYAKNMCLSPQFIGELRPITKVPLDVHIMVDNLDIDLIKEVIDAGGDIVSMPAELIEKNVFKYISFIKERGKKVGVVLNPATQLSAVSPYLRYVDLVTFMGVTPGFAKQKLVPEVLDKIREAISIREKKGYHFETQIDGGCHKESMKAIYETGVDVIIMGGTCLFSHSHDMDIAWKKMEEDFENWVL